VLEFAVHFEELGKLRRFMVYFPHAPVDLIEGRLGPDDLREDGFDLAVERPPCGGHPLLRKIPDADIFRLRDLSLVRGHLTHKYPEKRGFPRTVGTDKPDPVVRADAEGDLIEESPFARIQIPRRRLTRRSLLEVVLQGVRIDAAFFRDAYACNPVLIAELVEAGHEPVAQLYRGERVDVDAGPSFEAGGDVDAPLDEDVPGHLVHRVHGGVIPLFVAGDLTPHRGMDRVDEIADPLISSSVCS